MVSEVDFLYVQTGHLRSNETEKLNSAARSEAGERDFEWRSFESKPMEELDEFDAMEDSKQDLDEPDFQSGEYEIKHLTLEPNKTKEEAEKSAIRLLAARLESLHMNMTLIMLR